MVFHPVLVEVSRSWVRVWLPVNSSHGQVITQSSYHKPALYKATGRGPKFGGHAKLRVTTNVQNLGARRFLTGDRKFHLKIAKFQILPIVWLRDS